MSCAQLLVLHGAKNAKLQKMVLLTNRRVLSLSYSVTDGEKVCAHCLISVLLRRHATVTSENILVPLFPNK